MELTVIPNGVADESPKVFNEGLGEPVKKVSEQPCIWQNLKQI
jgi:hypothetical protein